MSYIVLCELGAMKDSIDSLKRGIPTLLPQLDDGGRAIIYNDWSLMEVDNSGAPLNKDEVRSKFVEEEARYDNAHSFLAFRIISSVNKSSVVSSTRCNGESYCSQKWFCFDVKYEKQPSPSYGWK